MLLASVGMVGGMILGDLAVGGRLVPEPVSGGSFVEFSANPDALTPDSLSSPPCIDCANSYAAAARLRARRAERMSNAFRDLGTVEIDEPAPRPEPDDEYRYGGRFPDPPSAIAARVSPSIQQRPAKVAAPAPAAQIGTPAAETPARPATGNNDVRQRRGDRTPTPPAPLPED